MKTDQEMVRWALEESSEPIIKNPYLRSMFAGGQLVQPGPGRQGYQGTGHSRGRGSTEFVDQYAKSTTGKKHLEAKEKDLVYDRETKKMRKKKTGYQKTNPFSPKRKGRANFYYRGATDEWIVYKRPPGAGGEKRQIYPFKKKSDALKFLKKGEEERLKGFKKTRDIRTKEVNKAYDNINSWTKTWLNKNMPEYTAKEFSKLEKDLANAWAKELKTNSSLYPKDIKGIRFDFSTKTNLPWARELKLSGLTSPVDKTSDPFFKKVFYKEKLKNPEFKKKVKDYLDWVVADKKLKTTKAKYAGLETPGTAAGRLKHLETAKINQFDEDVIHLISEMQKGDPSGIYVSLKEQFPDLLKKYSYKVSLGTTKWRENLRIVAENAGLDPDVLYKQMRNESAKVAKMLGMNVDKVPEELRYAIDHLAGLAEAANYTGPNKAAFSRKTLNTLMARTREQNYNLGKRTLSIPRSKLIRKFTKAKTLDDKVKIVGEINELVEKHIPGEIKYKVTGSGNLDFKALAPQKTIKARAAAYEKIPEVKKSFSAFKKGMYQEAQSNGIGVKKCGLKKAEGGRIGFAAGTQSFDDCMRGAIADETRIAKGMGAKARQAGQRLVGVGKWASKWIGLIDAPIEFAFALPALLRGDIEGAKRATTFGLAGWGKTQMEQMKETNPEAYKFLKHDNDIMDWQGAEWRRTQLEESKKRLEKMNVSGYGSNELNKVNTEIEELLAKQKNIEENYKGYEYTDEAALGKQMLGSYVKNEADRHREATEKGEVLGMQKPIVDEAFGELTPTSIMPEKERKAVDYPDTFGGYLMKKQFDKEEGRYREDPIIEALIEEGTYMDKEDWRKRYMREKSALSPAQLNAMYGSEAIQDYYGAVQSAQGFAEGGIVGLLKK
jgi:hypothetical protein